MPRHTHSYASTYSIRPDCLPSICLGMTFVCLGMLLSSASHVVVYCYTCLGMCIFACFPFPHMLRHASWHAQACPILPISYLPHASTYSLAFLSILFTVLFFNLCTCCGIHCIFLFLIVLSLFLLFSILMLDLSPAKQNKA